MGGRAGDEEVGFTGGALPAQAVQQRELFLAHVSEHRAPRIAAHWAYLLEPLVSDHSGQTGALRFRQIEYYRMPTMAYLALDEPRALTRNDFVRLGLLTAAPQREDDTLLPFAERPVHGGSLAADLREIPIGTQPAKHQAGQQNC